MSTTTTCGRSHVLVTGASSGIGRATALRLAIQGRHVFAGVRDPAAGQRLAAAAGVGVITPVRLDVTDGGQIAEAASEVADHVGPAGLAGLVNNAGIGLASPTELLPLQTFRELVEVNLTDQLAVTQAVLPLLRAARGRIVIVSTIGVRFLPPFAGPLDATKAALAALGDALRQELAPWGVRVVLVEPASIDSAAAGKVSRDAEAVMARRHPRAAPCTRTRSATCSRSCGTARRTAAAPTSRPRRLSGRSPRTGRGTCT
jgi:NAD(P)-dependent dehydrogenase (short-subunit alcohol dehydrogenase family)